MADAEFVITRVVEALNPWAEGTEPYTQGLSKGEHTRWLVPADGRKARRVLAGWRPYGMPSYIKWFAARSLTLLPAASGRVPGLQKLPPLPMLSGTRIGLSDAGPLSIVVYVGTPGPQRKAVCTVVDSDGQPLAIIKIVLADAADASLARESANLARLEAERPDLPVPRALALGGNGVHGQTILRGRPSGRKFTDRHAGFLLALREPVTADAGSVVTALRQRPIAAQLSARAIGQLDKMKAQVSAVWLHGDFAPWNLLTDSTGRLVAFDWEEGRPDGLPVWDIAHFHVQQSLLFNEQIRPLARMEANSAYAHYLRAMSLTDYEGRLLFCLYCVLTAETALANGSLAQARFLLKQVETEIGDR